VMFTLVNVSQVNDGKEWCIVSRKMSSFYLNDVTVRMICETELMTENWFRKKLD